ncbi:MAG TPA: ABC transporter permease [Anaerolineae bacterium]|nr:ABC transporter permease [Anaerolineae bacterium]
MDLLEGFRTALGSLATNKMRAILTTLGIIIGVAAVITLLAIGNGVSESIQGEIQSIGSNLITIITDYDNSDGYPSLSMGDVAAIEDPYYVPLVRRVAAEVQGTRQVLRGARETRVTVSGVTGNYFSVRNLVVEQGDGLTASDVSGSARVAVLGYGTTQDLFDDGTYAVGQSVKINGIQYRIVGVLEEKGGFGPMSQDEQVYVPLSTAQSRLFTRRTRSGERKVDIVYAEAVSQEGMDEATQQVKDLLRDRHEIAYLADDDFTVISQTQILDAFGVIMAGVNLFLGAIAGISLLVGGIGIMNIMLVSVTERTREIGIRKAVGALKRDILIQFLIESLLLSVLGGLIGIALGFGAATAIGNLSADLTPVVDIGTVAMSFSFAAAVGLIFGIYPAWRAASLRPIEALRYE